MAATLCTQSIGSYRGLRDRFDEYYLDQVAEWRRRVGQPPLTGLSSSMTLSVADVSPQTSVEPGVVVDPSVSRCQLVYLLLPVLGAGVVKSLRGLLRLIFYLLLFPIPRLLPVTLPGC